MCRSEVSIVQHDFRTVVRDYDIHFPIPPALRYLNAISPVCHKLHASATGTHWSVMKRSRCTTYRIGKWLSIRGARGLEGVVVWGPPLASIIRFSIPGPDCGVGKMGPTGPRLHGQGARITVAHPTGCAAPRACLRRCLPTRKLQYRLPWLWDITKTRCIAYSPCRRAETLLLSSPVSGIPRYWKEQQPSHLHPCSWCCSTESGEVQMLASSDSSLTSFGASPDCSPFYLPSHIMPKHITSQCSI